MLEKIKKGKLLERVKTLFDDAIANDAHFQRKAKESFSFRDGYGQWDKIEKDILEEERRPALTLNIVKAHVDLIMGLNEDIKKRYICTPVSPEDSFLCEVINNVIYWLYQRYDWESEEDNAYESSLISGRGWVALDFDIDEHKLDEIKITETSIPIHEVRFDPAARKRDLADASYVVWDRWLSLEDFAVKYPNHYQRIEELFLTKEWSTLDVELPSESDMGHDMNDESDYSDPLDINYFDSKQKQVRVCHMEYWKYVKHYFYWDIKDKKWIDFGDNLPELKKMFAKKYPNDTLVYETSMQKEVWWLQFHGNEILVHTRSPIDYPGFSIIPCFLYGDVSRRSSDHFGIVELMKDAQKEINKRSSQTLNLFNQQVQPGVYAEAQAFMDTDQAEQSMKEAGSITWLQDGALSQQRLQERGVPQFPTAVLQMGEYSREMIRHITGINPDLLGMNDKRKEAGIVVQLRQQQGMAILKPVFKSYSNMKKQLFERQVRIIMSHMPAHQIKKILGEGDRYEVEGDMIITDKATGLKCNLRDIGNIAYDIDAEPENNSMTANALEMSTLLEMQQQGIPVDPKIVVSKTNLPVSEKTAWLQYIESQQQGAQEQAQQEIQLKQQEMQMKYQIEMKKLEIQELSTKAKLQLQQEKDQLKVVTDQERINFEAAKQAKQDQIALMKILLDYKVADKEVERKIADMILDADHDRKRLLLDTVEVMAEARMSGAQLEIKAITDMYKMAMDAGTLNKKMELEFVGKVMDVMSRAKEAKKGENSNGNSGQQAKND